MAWSSFRLPLEKMLIYQYPAPPHCTTPGRGRGAMGVAQVARGVLRGIAGGGSAITALLSVCKQQKVLYNIHSAVQLVALTWSKSPPHSPAQDHSAGFSSKQQTGTRQGQTGTNGEQQGTAGNEEDREGPRRTRSDRDKSQVRARAMDYGL